MVTRIPLGTRDTLSSPSCLPAGARLANSRKKRRRERVRIGNGIRIKIRIKIKMRKQQKQQKGPDTYWHPTRHYSRPLVP